jgi:hypothetical protein
MSYDARLPRHGALPPWARRPRRDIAAVPKTWHGTSRPKGEQLSESRGSGARSVSPLDQRNRIELQFA